MAGDQAFFSGARKTPTFALQKGTTNPRLGQPKWGTQGNAIVSPKFLLACTAQAQNEVSQDRSRRFSHLLR